MSRGSGRPWTECKVLTQQVSWTRDRPVPDCREEGTECRTKKTIGVESFPVVVGNERVRLLDSLTEFRDSEGQVFLKCQSRFVWSMRWYVPTRMTVPTQCRYEGGVEGRRYRRRHERDERKGKSEISDVLSSY